MAITKNPLVSIVIVNWNGLKDTLNCLRLVKALNYSNFEIIVVDNGSSDGSKEALPKEKGINFISLPNNTGFAGGHIAALKEARGSFLLLLNNDLAIHPEWINCALTTFTKYPKVAVVGGKQYKWNDDNPVFNESNEYFAYQEVNPENGQTYTLLVGEDECSVDAISGACLMIKRKAIDKTGYLDNDFFLYYEETDLIARMLRAGYKAFYNPKAMVWHKIAGSTKNGDRSSMYLYMMHRNRYLFALKNLDDEIVRLFKKNYLREVSRASIKWLLKKDLESKLRVKAYAWNKMHLQKTLSKRREIKKLGSSYIKRLHSYKPVDTTVIIPCYNYGDFVTEAIESALNQTVRPKKVIVINDGSTDNSRKVIDKYKNSPLVEVVHQKNNGLVATKNLGISKTKTYWTIFLDADDKLDPKYIEKLTNLANSGRFDVTYTDMEIFGAVSDIIRSKPFDIRSMLQRSYIHNSALLKTSLLKQLGGYKEEMKDGLEDWELYLSLYELGATFAHLDEPILKYRYHASPISRNTYVAQREMEFYKRLVKLHPRLFSYRARAKRWLTRIIYLLLLLARRPGLILIVLKSLPHIVTGGNSGFLKKVRSYQNNNKAT